MARLPRVPKAPRVIRRKTANSRAVKRPRALKIDVEGVDGRPRKKRSKRALIIGRKAGRALSSAVDAGMKQIIAGDFAGAYETILGKMKGDLLDTLNRSLANIGLPPVSDSGPDTDYFKAAVLEKCGLEINDLTVGGLTDFGEKLLWKGVENSVGIKMDGVTTLDDAVRVCVQNVVDGNVNLSVVLSEADSKRARIMSAIKSSHKTYDDYLKALARRRASESGRKS